MIVNERYQPVIMAANTTQVVYNQSIGGFLCTVTGVLNVTAGPSATSVVSALPVTAGIYYPLPLILGPQGGTVVLSGGAAGTLLV